MPIGKDGVAPQYDPEGLWKIWNRAELYFGPNTPGRAHFVPKVLDYVIEPTTYEMWVVQSIDPVTLIPTLRSIKPYGATYELTEDDVLFGVGPGSDAETYRAYLNDSVFPHTLVVDQRLKINGVLSSYAKIFLGSDTSAESGKVISKMYDASGNFLSTSVPLELVALDSHTNYSVKSVKRCYVTEKIKDAERITVVIYADDGHVVSKRQLLIENCDLIANINDGTKYITDISLESIWLSNTAPDQLDYPLNIPMDALNLMGVVHYSDGTTLRLPVGNTKFDMLGLAGRLATIPGQPHDLVLRYRLSAGEVAYSSNGVNGQYIRKPYRLMTTNPNNSIAVKLFGYPYWESEVTGYKMRWFLLNLARNLFFEVTAYVKYAASTGPFDPLRYGYVQRKAVMLNLRDVSGTFIPFNHSQVVDIVLNNPPGDDALPAWTVGTEASDTYPRFGEEVYAKRVNATQVNLKAGHETYEDWLMHYYRHTRPLVNNEVEVEAPAPSHFIVTYGTTVSEWTMDQWDQNIAIAAAVVAKNTITIRFVKRTASGDLQLSYAAAVVKTF